MHSPSSHTSTWMPLTLKFSPLARGVGLGEEVTEGAVHLESRGTAAEGMASRLAVQWSEKFCNICHMTGKPTLLFTFHKTVDCKPLYAALRSIYVDNPNVEYKGEGKE